MQKIMDWYVLLQCQGCGTIEGSTCSSIKVIHKWDWLTDLTAAMWLPVYIHEYHIMWCSIMVTDRNPRWTNSLACVTSHGINVLKELNFLAVYWCQRKVWRPLTVMAHWFVRNTYMWHCAALLHARLNVHVVPLAKFNKRYSKCVIIIFSWLWNE